MRYLFILISSLCMMQSVYAKDDSVLIGEDEGVASYYHARFHGRKSASGHVHDKDDLTAAHRSLPFGTNLRVTNLKNDKSVIVRVADRGPFRRGRIIDVSEKAAEQLDFVKQGITRVKIEVVPFSKEPLEMDFMFPLNPIPMISINPLRPEISQDLLSCE